MLSLTRKTEYALLALCHLARTRAGVTSARDIAGQHAVSVSLLMNVLKRLQTCGLVRSVRGSRGGYVLARGPDQITLADLVEAIEGPVRLVRCVPAERDPDAEPHGTCELVGTCVIRQPLQRVHEQLRRFLDELTIAQIAFEERLTELRRPALGLRTLPADAEPQPEAARA